YPHLSHMALDYLTIPATSVDVERLFSHGRLLLTHVCSCLTTQSTCTLLCLGYWSQVGLIKTEDVQQVGKLPDVIGGEELVEGWDAINFDK
ncbi:hypothetical protein PAXRUDRAFT_154329, partial [Paxillus rubicundulus Ve08.2h10]